MKNFRNLVFEGGGVRGIAYGGALTKLNELEVLPGIKRVAGTSAGAITAVLLAVGYTDKEVSDIVAKTNFKDFADDDTGYLRDTIRLVRKYGWHKGNYFREWMGKLIGVKTGKKNLTFKELAESNLEGKKELYLVGTNLTAQVSKIFSHEDKHTPNLEIREAARISMSIPLYFRCARWGKNKAVMVDGGVTWNYPINIFDYKRYLFEEVNGEPEEYNKTAGFAFNYETLGFRLDTRDEIRYRLCHQSRQLKKIENIMDYAKALAGFMQEMANKRHIHANDWKRTVFIDTLTVKTTDFEISDELIDKLIESGRTGVEEYFKWRKEKSGLKKPV